MNLIVDIPERLSDLLYRFLNQNGRLSRRARRNQFAALTEDESGQIEALYGAAFGAGQR